MAGLGLTAYPIVSEFYTQRHQSQVYTAYQEELKQADSKELDAARRVAARYNAAVASGATAAALEALDYESLLKPTGSGIMGYIEIPAIEVLLPIDHGVDEDSLERIAGHMPSTAAHWRQGHSRRHLHPHWYGRFSDVHRPGATGNRRCFPHPHTGRNPYIDKVFHPLERALSGRINYPNTWIALQVFG